MSDVLVDVAASGVAVVTLNRPDRLNAWTREMAVELSDAMAHLDIDDAVRAVVLTGAGRAFCAGVDIGRFTARSDTEPARRPWIERVVPSQMVKPVVAAINGPAVGVGLAYAMHCDVRFVAAEAKVGFAFNRRGMAPEVAMHVVLPRIVGVEVAADLLLSGRIVLGADAVGMGLASEALAADEVLPRAVAWAEDVAANCSPASVGATKQLLWGRQREEIRAALAVEDQLAIAFAAEPDSREGMVAFREKRGPAWSSVHRAGARRAADAVSAVSDVANDRRSP